MISSDIFVQFRSPQNREYLRKKLSIVVDQHELDTFSRVSPKYLDDNFKEMWAGVRLLNTVFVEVYQEKISKLILDGEDDDAWGPGDATRTAEDAIAQYKSMGRVAAPAPKSSRTIRQSRRFGSRIGYSSDIHDDVQPVAREDDCHVRRWSVRKPKLRTSTPYA